MRMPIVFAFASADRQHAIHTEHAMHAELSLKEHVVQVSGLPTNQEFLKRLATHPAFIAAGLSLRLSLCCRSVGYQPIRSS